MKYWGFLAAKLTVGSAVAIAVAWSLRRWYPMPAPVFGERTDPFGRDLTYTFVMLAYFLFCLGLVSLIVRDQRLRCRACLRRLRMPIATGSWNHVLFGPPRMEYICPYGHGTLKVAELQITGPHPPDWQAHEDMWRELFSAGESKR